MTATQPQNAVLLTPQELADKLKMSLKWVTKQTQARCIPGQVKVGRLWRYRASEVEKRLLNAQFLTVSK